MDYLELNSILSFDACHTRRCINVTIVDDLVDEPLEYFDFTLERTPDLDTRISLNPVDGWIAIIDNGKFFRSFHLLPRCTLHIMRMHFVSACAFFNVY